MTAPNEAPEETPNTEGDASGLRNIPCITEPHNARLAPANNAIITRGNRTSIIMLLCQLGIFVCISLDNCCLIIPPILLSGISAGPCRTAITVNIIKRTNKEIKINVMARELLNMAALLIVINVRMQ